MPQAPGACAAEEEAEAPFALTANTECCFARSSPWHDGQTAGRDAVTMASKWRSQSRQMYSKMGTVLIVICSAMTQDRDAMLALKNAWTGALASADRLRELAPAVPDLPATAALTDVDLEACAAAALANANAAQALRGLIEQLRRKAGDAA